MIPPANAAGDAERVDHLLFVCADSFSKPPLPQRSRPERRRRNPAIVDPLWRHEAQAPQRLDADRDAKERIDAAAPEALAGGKHSRHDQAPECTGPLRTCFVEVLAMRCGAVQKGGVFWTQAVRVPERSARPASIEAA